MNRILHRIAVPLICTIVLAASLTGTRTAIASDPGLDRQIAVALVSRSDLAAIRETYSLKVLKRLGRRPMYLFRTPVNGDVDGLIQALRNDSRIVFAERNFVVFEPEARRRAVWAIGNAGGFVKQWAPRHNRLWETQTFATGNGVTVAVIDTGVDLTHPGLNGHLVPGYDFVDRDADPSEVGTIGELGFGHGTHVAGLVALTAPDARIMPLRALGAGGRGDIWTVAEALLHAADPDGQPATADHAQVINLSLGTLSPTRLLDQVVELVTCSNDDDDDEDDAFTDSGYAFDRTRCDLHYGSVVVAAAGNGGSATQLMFPAAERAEGALSVTAHNRSDLLAKFGNRGPWVQIAAPGAGITSTVPGGTYGVWNGTSMAAAFVSGIAALVREVNPDWKPVDVTKRIEDRSAALCGTTLRRVDAYGAVFDENPAITVCP